MKMFNKMGILILVLIILSMPVLAGFSTLWNPWTNRLDFVRDLVFDGDKVYFDEVDIANNLTVHGYVAVIETLDVRDIGNQTITGGSEGTVYVLNNYTDVVNSTFKAYEYNGSVLTLINSSLYDLNYREGLWSLDTSIYNNHNFTLDYQIEYLAKNLSAGDLYVEHNVTADWFFGNLNWSDVQNKFITAVDNVWIYMSGTTATFNLTKLDDEYANKTYMADADTAINTSATDYADNILLEQNTSLTTYIDGQDTLFNDSITTYIDNQDTVFNDSMTTYTDNAFVEVVGDTMTGNLSFNADANLNAISYTTPNETFWNLKASPSSSSNKPIVSIEADGSNWDLGGSVLELISDDPQSYLISGSNGASTIFYVDRSGNIYQSGNSIFGSGGEIQTSNNGNITLLPNGNGITQVGDAGETSHSLADNDDLMVSGKLEVDGTSYFDSGVELYSFIRVRDTIPLYFGTASDVIFYYVTAQTPDSLVLGLSSDSNGLIITEKADANVDFAQPLKDNPTLFIQSAEETQTDQFLSLEHDQNDSRIASGYGDLRLSAADGVSIDSDFKMGDEDNYLLFERYVNGTHILFNSPQSLPYYFEGAGLIVSNLTVTNNNIVVSDNVNVTWDNGAHISVNSTCLILSSPGGTDYAYCD